MGWTSQYMYSRPSRDEIKSLILEELECSNEYGVHQHVPGMVSLQSDACYVVMRHHEVSDGVDVNVKYYEAVVLWKYLDNEFLTKAMDESVGPLCYGAPKNHVKLLNANSPLEDTPANRNAIGWRDMVLNKQTPKTGDRLRFKNAITFIVCGNKETLHEFIYNKPTKGGVYFTDPSGKMGLLNLKIRNWSKRQYQIMDRIN